MTTAATTGDQREDEAEEGSEILAEDDDQLGLAALAKPAREAARAARFVDLDQARAHRDRFGSDADDEHADGPPPLLERLGMLQFVNALVEGEHAADAEEDHGDEERPEVDGFAVAERIVRRRRSARLSQAEQQKQLVAAVGERVHRLREHRAGAGDECGYALRDEDRRSSRRARTGWRDSSRRGLPLTNPGVGCDAGV